MGGGSGGGGAWFGEMSMQDGGDRLVTSFGVLHARSFVRRGPFSQAFDLAMIRRPHASNGTPSPTTPAPSKDLSDHPLARR